MSISILRLPQVKARVGLGRTSIYKLVSSGEFPAPIKLSAQCVGWVESDVNAWLEQKVKQSRVS